MVQALQYSERGPKQVSYETVWGQMVDMGMRGCLDVGKRSSCKRSPNHMPDEFPLCYDKCRDACMPPRVAVCVCRLKGDRNPHLRLVLERRTNVERSPGLHYALPRHPHFSL